MSYFKGIGIKSGSYAGKKLPLVGLLENKKHTIFNEYTVGSGVGASSVATRRLKKQRARIKKCPPSTPIIPELNEYEYFEISDDFTSFNMNLEQQIKALQLETSIDLGNNFNNSVDADVYKTYATSHINEVSKSNNVTSLTFTTTSVVNPVNIAVNNSGVVNIDALLSSDDYKITTSINYYEEIEPISQNIEHTFINTGKTEGSLKLIEYVMTITVFESLQ